MKVFLAVIFFCQMFGLLKSFVNASRDNDRNSAIAELIAGALVHGGIMCWIIYLWRGLE